MKDEVEQLRVKYPQLLHGQNYEWILVPDFRLPVDRFNKEQSRLLVIVPSGYPSTPPDDFFVDGDLRLRAGGTPPAMNLGPNSSSGVAPVAGEWAWFSWHAANWSLSSTVTGGDNLVTYLRSVNACLRGEDL